MLWTTHAVGNNHGKLAGNACKEHIRFCGGMVTCFSPGDTHAGFEVVDGTFHNGSDFIGGIPFIRITLDAGEHAEVHVIVSISGPAFFGSTARVFTIADPLPFYHVNFWANPFITVRVVLE